MPDMFFPVFDASKGSLVDDYSCLL